MRLSDTQRACIIEATIQPLRRFPKGYGRPSGEVFFDHRTVGSLLKTGHLRMIYPPGGWRPFVTARAA
ncbi:MULTISPECIES: hypothetical protein [unclassified Bradyrhizobium]|uniref:hypothetical protein n=1 Tax=unclassified Bradyrhizobium TaxID=2631580 RepID=UPI00247A2E68|nr:MULTISPECIES: hypothetical protein [unclassified Bradyrhizobium]WGR74311.1 hypothetical protein MTX24_16435 [Bradyrhizobium sp. ISRA426]WGR79146.1 hypothetical protein MTX21_01550 [Bradyrhizobium sp. ISRA430]WGR90634.1 hypothetical protein MTX25_39695 [Bradyrhizobium sp. ISRA432]